jgi:hypothetical protein
MSNRCRSLLLLFLLLAVSLADQLRTQTHVRVRGSEEEKQKAEARNSAERNKAQQIVNENEKKNVEEHNKPAEAQEKKNEEFLQHCKREEKEAAVNHQKQVEQDREDQIRIDGEIEAAMAENAYDIIGGGSINIDSSPKEIQASYEKTTNNFPPPQLRSAEDSAELLKVQKAYDTLNDPVSKSAYDATFDQVSGQVQGILHMCNHPFHAAKDHVDCSRLATSTPTIYTYDLLAWDVYQTSFNAIPSALHYNNTKPLPKETIALLTYPTAIPKCWSIIKQCIPNIEHFTPAEALTEEMKDGSNPDEQQNQGLGPLLKSFGLIDMLDAKLETLTLESLLPKDLKGMAPMLENIVGPRKMYDLNVKPLLENTNSLWGERLFDQVCGFFPGLLPPIAPREVESKFGPHLLIPQLPLLPNTIRFPIGEITLTKEGGLHISKPMYEMLLNFGPMLPGVKVMGTEMKLDMALKMICNNGNCPASLASMIVQLIPGDLFNELTKEVTSFHDVINFLIDKYTGGKIKLGENVPLPPPLSYLWGEGLLQKTGPKSCTLSAFPMQNTLEYHYDDPVLVEQYCNLANYVWCNGKPNECTREGGAIFAHATGALTLLKGLELGVCNPQMKINMIDAPLKGISLLELLHRRDEIWCVNQQKDKYFDAFFNDIKQVTPVCGNTLGDFVKRFGTSIGGLLTTIGSSFKETSLSMIASPATTSTTATTANLAPTNPATTAKTAKETMKQFHKNQKTDDAVLALIDTMDTNNVYQLHSRSHNEQQAFIHLFHNLPATKNGKASVNNKNDLMKSFSLLEQKHKLHAISLFRRLDIEEQKRHLPVGEYMDEEAETAMQAIDLRKWSQKDQQMLIEMFEQEVLHKESRDEKKIKLIKEQEQEQKLKAFTGTTSPSKKTAPALLRRRRSLLSMRNTAGRVVKRRGWFKKAAKAVVGVVKSVVNFVVPAIKSAASWINENAIQPTVQFVKKYVIEPAANFLNNCIQFFKGLVSFNPRETIAGVVRNVICGKSEVAHKIAWGTSNANVAELDLGLIDKAITDGVSKIQEFMEDHFNDPNFGVQLEEILNHMKKLSPSQMSKTTLSATAKKHTLGVHCGASYLGLPLPMAPEVNIFQNLWTPNILKDVVRFVDANVNKNSILMSVKSAIGSCGATMVVDKAFPWMMKAIPGLAQCIPTIIEPFLNEDNTNGIGETRSCGDSSIYGDQKASILAAKTSFVEMDEKDCGLRCFHPLPPNFELSQADYEKQEKQKQQEKENIQKEGASKIIDEDEAATQEAAGGRCLPQVAHEDDACINLATQELCEAAGTGGGTGTGTGTDASLMQVEEQSVPPMSAQHYAKLNEEATQKAAAETTLNCRWQAIEQSDIVFPKSLPDVREYALEQEEHLKSQRQKELEEECNVEYVPDSGPTSSNGGFNPMILAKEGFSTFPSSPKYISNCNYINTMGVSGNDPQKGCAPHCWMGFRMLELAKMRKNLPVPPIPPSGFGNRQPLDLPPQKAEEEEDPVGAEQETESGAAAWTPDPACIMVNDPYTQAGYYGYIVDIDQFTDAKEISNGIRELANLLAMIDMHPSIPAEAKDILKTCEPRLKTVLVRFRLSFFLSAAETKRLFLFFFLSIPSTCV